MVFVISVNAVSTKLYFNLLTEAGQVSKDNFLSLAQTMLGSRNPISFRFKEKKEKEILLCPAPRIPSSLLSPAPAKP